MQRNRLEFSLASALSQGARPYQEDSVRIWHPDGAERVNGQRRAVLAILSDGMGGHVSGEVASKLVSNQCVQHFATIPGDPEDKIKTVLGASNESLEQAIRSNSALSGMGCTLVAAYLDSEGVRWASVGDSSLLLFRGDQLYRLNDNHSLGALLDKQAAANLITYEEAYNSPNRHSLRSALTGGPIAIADIAHSAQSLLPGDWLIIASDGLDTLSADEIATTVGDASAGTPEDLTRRLLEEVGRRAVPNQDNTSVIAVRVRAEEVTERVDRHGQLSNGTGASHRERDGDTEVVSMIHGTLIGEAKNSSPAAPTVLIRRPARRVGFTGLAALAVVVMLASTLFFAYLFEVFSTSPSAKTDTAPPAKTENAPSAKTDTDPSVKSDATHK